MMRVSVVSRNKASRREQRLSVTRSRTSVEVKVHLTVEQAEALARYLDSSKFGNRTSHVLYNDDAEALGGAFEALRLELEDVDYVNI